MAARPARQKASAAPAPPAFESFLVWTPHGFRRTDASPELPARIPACEYYRIPAGKRAQSPQGLIAAIQEGLPVSNFQGLSRAMGVTVDDLCAVTGIALRTLRRRKTHGRLTAQESERVYRVANVFNRAVSVFGGAAAARTWIREPLVALAGRTPLQYCGTEIGAREVEDILGRIRHGDFS